jgi:quercetin dioxygenase-like cupin family protein
MTNTRIRVVLGAAIVASGLTTMAMVSAQDKPAADDPRFTGVSTVLDAKDVSAGRRRFEPGARSAWHSHDNGQLLYVEAGRMRTGTRGAKVKEYGPGESEYTGPKVEHWHGAVPQTHLIQINIGFGGETRWLQKTTDAEYNAK